jgi:potassium efflux system protein
MVSKLSELNDKVAQANTQAQRLEEDFKSARETVEIGGLSQELGHMLLVQRQSLPDASAFRRQANEREKSAAQIGVQRLQHRLVQKRLRDLDAYVAEVSAAVSEEELPLLRDQISKLAIERRGLLVKAIETDDFYLLKLGELESAQQSLLSVINSYDAFLDEHLLWVRSASQTGLDSLRALPEQAWQILSPKGWLDVVRTFWREATRSSFNLLILIAFGALFLGRKYLISISERNSDKIGKPTTDRFAYSLQALFITIILAANWPMVMAVSGWLIKGSAEGSNFSNVVGTSLIKVALQLFYLRLFYMICLPGGLAARHFRWTESSLQLLRTSLSGLIWFYLPASMITIIAFNLDPLNASWIIGRVAFLVMVGALAYAYYQTLHPTRGVLTGYLGRQGARSLKNLYWLSYPVLVTAPIALGILSLMGFLYTAGTLLSLLVQTSWLVVGLILLAALAQRWVVVTRRHVAYEVAVEQQEAQMEAQEHADGLYQEIEEPEPDLAALSDASRKLLNTVIIFIGAIGLWLIWSEVLPAFRILDDVALWNSTVKVDGVEHTLPITLTDMVLTLLYLTATIILAKQLPAVLEIILLQRSEMSAASRYTVTTLSTYTIVTLGAILIFSTLGVDWSKLQWLVAALGVGIGFGLQEIVANFISGIIILFERPIRVGDVVTVGDTDGKVTRIRIRATTIRNWDGKELLVPNKEFITGRLLNWSLSDQTTRILILVGIAYGSDVRKAISLLEEAARENDRVMEDPEPSVIFEAFGDSALNMVLRCFIESPDGRMGLISSLNESINEKFNNAGISIAFPQRDIHLKASEPVSVRIESADNSVPHQDRGT